MIHEGSHAGNANDRQAHGSDCRTWQKAPVRRELPWLPVLRRHLTFRVVMYGVRMVEHRRGSSVHSHGQQNSCNTATRGGVFIYMPVRLTPEIITAAIRGFEEQKRHIDGQIAELQATLSGGPAEPAAMPDGATRKRKISAAARRRMALGQQARWAKIRGESGHPEPATPEPAKPKRKAEAQAQ
ncbi:hypothetical protein SBA3_2530005 [Candidatus Sulfopaludibacter sp. SbA3]|nr:hypothetical protein SBA3_2530005 [Candidatus Sulfopaludibacter sp. SbA3]